jgi:UDP-glucose:(heptosyl)LPS alpha-1,3-glucosyltransferase
MPGQAESRLRRGAATALGARLFGRFNSYRRMMADLERRIVSDPRVTCLALSELVAGEFRRHYGRSEGVRVIYNGVDAPNVTPEDRQTWRARRRGEIGVAEGDLLFLVVAKNLSLKGVDETMSHFLRWCDTRTGVGRARLVVVGQAIPAPLHYSSRVRETARRIPMVAWTPDIFEWYSAADACVLLSWYDACSRVVLEAVRWGVPCITTRYNGAAEVLGEGGVIVDSPRDLEGVLAAFDAMRDSARRAAFAEACRRIGPTLTMDRHVEQLLEAYGAGAGTVPASQG